MSREQITLYQPDALVPDATHFGVSVDNCFSSTPDLGLQAVEIAQSGLIIVGPRQGSLRRRPELRPDELFTDVYIDPDSSGNSVQEQADNYVTTNIPDHVVEYCKKRNITPGTVVRVGLNLVRFALKTGAGLAVGLDVYAGRAPAKKGMLDSKLSFSISPINTIIMKRKSVSAKEQLRARLETR